MEQKTRDLVNSINAGEHSEEALSFVKSAVDHVETTCGESKYVRLIRDALQRKSDPVLFQHKAQLERFIREHPDAEGCMLNKDGTVEQMGTLRPIGKFTDL